MKPFWDDLFYDLENSAFDKEGFASSAGKTIRDDLMRIEDAIKQHDGKKALALIEEFKGDY